MENLKNRQNYRDRKTEYWIYSHHKLSDTQELEAIKKKSLHTSLEIPPHLAAQGVNKLIQVLAADGWEEAE